MLHIAYKSGAEVKPLKKETRKDRVEKFAMSLCARWSKKDRISAAEKYPLPELKLTER